MKNIEKYQRTNDAIEEWDKYHDGGGDMPFDVTSSFSGTPEPI